MSMKMTISLIGKRTSVSSLQSLIKSQKGSQQRISGSGTGFTRHQLFQMLFEKVDPFTLGLSLALLEHTVIQAIERT